MIALRRWNAGRRAEEGQVKHLGTLVRGTVRLGPFRIDNSLTRKVASMNSQPSLTSAHSIPVAVVPVDEEAPRTPAAVRGGDKIVAPIERVPLRSPASWWWPA